VNERLDHTNARAVLDAILALDDCDRDQILDAFNTVLDELRAQDFFGTEGQLDPRGDGRESARRSPKMSVLMVGIASENDDEPIAENAEIARCGPFYALLVTSDRNALSTVLNTFPLTCSVVDSNSDAEPPETT